MKRELGIARCGLACCLCSENAECKGCKRDGLRNEEAGIIYHKEGIIGDYDDFDIETLISFIKTGAR